MNEHTLREQLQNEIRRCAEAVARAREAEADRDRLADALAAERQQVAVESGESDRLEALLEDESRLRRGLEITADSLAAKLNEVNAENDRLAAIIASCPRCAQRVEITPESLGAPSYADLAAENDRLRAIVLDELTREGQALESDRLPVPGEEVPPESSPDEDRSGGAWGDYMRDAHICPDCHGMGCDACGGAGELPQFNERLAAALDRPRQFRWADERAELLKEPRAKAAYDDLTREIDAYVERKQAEGQNG